MKNWFKRYEWELLIVSAGLIVIGWVIAMYYIPVR